MEELKNKLTKSHDKNIIQLEDINKKYITLSKNIDSIEKTINFTDFHDVTKIYKSTQDTFMNIVF